LIKQNIIYKDTTGMTNRMFHAGYGNIRLTIAKPYARYISAIHRLQAVPRRLSLQWVVRRVTSHYISSFVF